MKKLLLMVAIGVAGFMNANTFLPYMQINSNIEIETSLLKTNKFGVTYYVTVTTSCGTTHSYNHYFNYNNPTETDFQNIIKSWNLIDCDDNSTSGSIKKNKVLTTN